MTTDEEQALSHRLHGLVANPPAGRNLMPAIRKAAHRRRTRVAAVSSSLGVAGVVVAGAATASLKADRQSASGTAASTSPLVRPSSEPSAASTTAAAPSTTPTTVAPPSAKNGPTPAARPSLTTVAPVGDTAAEVTKAPYWYQRTLNEQYGSRTVRRAWIGRTAPGRVQQPGGPGAALATIPLGTADFITSYGERLSWADFATTPSGGQLHEWLYATPATSVQDFGYDVGGTTRGNQLAFKTGEELLTETPAVASFRLAVLAAMKQIPGVVVTSSVTDEIGRTGVQLSLKAGPNMGVGTTADIFDPADGRLLQSTLSDDPVCPHGTVIWRGVYLESGVVPDDSSVLPELATDGLGKPADCVLPGEQTPPAAKP